MVDNTDADLAAFGVTDRPAAAQAGHFEVLEENEQVLRLFITCATQWRVGSGGAVGLDYSAVIQVMKLYSIKNRRSVFEDLQVMEAAALAKLNDKAAH